MPLVVLLDDLAQRLGESHGILLETGDAVSPLRIVGVSREGRAQAGHHLVEQLVADRVVEIGEVKDLVVGDEGARDQRGDEQQGIGDPQRVGAASDRTHLRPQVGVIPVDLGLGTETVVREFFEVHEEGLLHTAGTAPELDALPGVAHHLAEHPISGEDGLGGWVLTTELETARL